MKAFVYLKNSVSTYLNNGNESDIFIKLFCKALYVFLLLKIAFVWTVLTDAQQYFPFTISSFWSLTFYLPLRLAQSNLNFFLILVIIITVTSLLIRPNYITAFLIFWLSCCVTRLGITVINGSDLVLNLFLFLGIFLPTVPKFHRSDFSEIQTVISQCAFLMVQIQMVLIYFLSGYDKLITYEWRSGEAIHSIMQLEFFALPFLHVELNAVALVLLAWSVILFELGFAVLILFKPFRLPLLIIGVVFHLVIIFLLAIPDFGIVMLIGYIPFLSGLRTRHPQLVAESNLR